MQALIYWYSVFLFKTEKVRQLLRLFNRDGGFHMVISKDSVPATYWDFFFLQLVQVVDSQCCGLRNLTITELDSILCLLYRSSFVRQNFRPFHIMLKLTRSLYEFISYRRMWIQLYLLTLAVWFCEQIMFLPVIAK